MNKERIDQILVNHRAWLVGDGGERANLSGANLANADLRRVNLRDANFNDANLYDANLSGANLSGADLRGANLKGANLIYANLRGAILNDANLRGADFNDANLSRANLRGVNLKGANLKGANLIYADLRGANLIGTDFSYANLRDANLEDAELGGANLNEADLREANLTGVRYNKDTAFFALQCPEEGSFIGWKKCKNDVIVKLLIPEDAERSSATSRKCRASKAVVLEVIGAEKGFSTNDGRFVYVVGKEVFPDSFDKDRWKECSHGIHFFITRKEAEDY